jgi:hypothetical protein
MEQSWWSSLKEALIIAQLVSIFRDMEERRKVRKRERKASHASNELGVSLYSDRPKYQVNVKIIMKEETNEQK